MAEVVIFALYVDGTPKSIPDEFFRDGGLSRPEYLVTHDDRGWRCTCPQWIYRLSKSKGRCKHIEQCLPDLQAMRDLLAWWRKQLGGGENPTAEERLSWLES